MVKSKNLLKSRKKNYLAKKKTKRNYLKKIKKVSKKNKKVSKKNRRKSKKAGNIIQNVAARSVNTVQQFLANLTSEKVQFLGVLMITKNENIRLIYNLFHNNRQNIQNEQSHISNVNNLYNTYRKYNDIMPFINPKKSELCTGQKYNQKNSDRTSNFKNAFILGGPSNPMTEQGKFSIIDSKIFYRSSIVIMQLILYRLFEPNPNNLFLDILAYIIHSAKNNEPIDNVINFLTTNIKLDENKDRYSLFPRNKIEDDLRLRVSQAHEKYNVENTNPDQNAPAKITERYMLASLVSTISIFNINDRNDNAVKSSNTNDIQCSGFLSKGIKLLVDKINTTQNFQYNINNKWSTLLLKRRGNLGVSSNFNVNLGLGGNYDIFRNGILQKQVGIVIPSILELFTFLFTPKVNYNKVTSQSTTIINNDVNMQAEASSISDTIFRNKKKIINSSSHRDEFRLIFKDKIDKLLESSNSNSAEENTTAAVNTSNNNDPNNNRDPNNNSNQI